MSLREVIMAASASAPSSNTMTAIHSLDELASSYAGKVVVYESNNPTSSMKFCQQDAFQINGVFIAKVDRDIHAYAGNPTGKSQGIGLEILLVRGKVGRATVVFEDRDFTKNDLSMRFPTAEENKAIYVALDSEEAQFPWMVGKDKERILSVVKASIESGENKS